MPLMTFHTETLRVRTGTHETVHDLTADCESFLAAHAAGRDGLLNLFVPHATAGLAILETGAGSDDDLLAILQTLLPPTHPWHHRHGTPGHGRDHVLPALVPPHATLPVTSGHLALGTWQSVCMVDTNVDNPDRQVRLSFLG
ncbi:YjbQ family protein [Streptomyces sp. AM 3-1-1]|uniref:YjbQ family protein n=1 Tax=Streptomyces sp. AM 3-1-1 TaxID=3028711 RepID=UPI0023B9CF3C|nr:YjbQ family protein [Streptomyces sp. AM 3-1-1]WEH31238.1 YjbQ family protein [Streptomyces sp. AM 3-1-1]